MKKKVKEEKGKDRWKEIEGEVAPADMERMMAGGCSTGTVMGVKTYCEHFNRDHKVKGHPFYGE